MNREKPFNELPLLPPATDIETKAILKKAISANRCLAELNGIVNSIPNKNILIDSIVLQEARLSSEIENIVTTNDELFRAVDSHQKNINPQAKEVLRYKEALWHGYEKVKEKPLSTNLFIDIVRVIKGLKIEVRKSPGTKIANSKGEAVYTPPEGESIIRDKLANLEKFMHDDNTINPLIKMAVMHYQFEAIHPFIDGNGRTGRIINILFLLEKGLLDSPVLFLSQYILDTRKNYYAGLRKVTEEGAWEDWILYMLEGVEVTALETKNKVMAILNAMTQVAKFIQEKAPKIYSKDLVEIIFRHPYCKIAFIEEAGLVKRQTAGVYLQTLEELGLLTSVKLGKEVYYINNKLFDILRGRG